MAVPEVAFVTSGIRSLSGGIAAVNANIIVALAELARSGRIVLEVDSLLETEEHRPPELPDSVSWRGFAGSRSGLAVRTLVHATVRRWILYERVGLAVATGPLAVAGGVRSVVFAHGSENWRNVRVRDFLSLRGADLVMANSWYTLRHMQEHPAVSRRLNAVVCALGLSPAFPLHATPPKDDGAVVEVTAADGQTRALGSRVLLMVARMDPLEGQKGHAEMIAAMPTVLARFPDAQLVFAGPGDDRPRFEQLARESGASAAIFFPGLVPTELLSRLYRRCYAFTMPSRQEGFGLVFLEAMNFAKACLGCREDGAADVIVDGETGVLMPVPLDVAQLAQALCWLLENPQAVSRMGLAGLARLHREFAPEQFRARFTEIFMKAIQ